MWTMSVCHQSDSRRFSSTGPRESRDLKCYSTPFLLSVYHDVLTEVSSCNPTGCNPSGCSSTKERKLEILRIAKRFGILILEGKLPSASF